MFTSVKDIVNAPSAKSGIAVITVPDIRWERRDIKSVALLAQVLAKQAAAEAGAGEAWMIEDGKVTEGGSSSAFILTQDDVLVTRQNSSAILPGCTRKAVVALAEERQLRVEERPFTVEEALAAKEAFTTSATAVRAGGGEHRWQDCRRWQAGPDDEPVARDLCGFRPRNRGVDRARNDRSGRRSTGLHRRNRAEADASRFHALMVAISMVRLTVSASENCARNRVIDVIGRVGFRDQCHRLGPGQRGAFALRVERRFPPGIRADTAAARFRRACARPRCAC